MGHYAKFAAMIATSMVVMLALTYLSTFEPSHVFYSQTRFYQVLIMGGAMAVVMLAFMLNMYKQRAVNLSILVLAVAMITGGTLMMRNQTGIDDVAYMRAMIPHHSIALLTSRNASISDPRVRELADEIIEAQEREIAEMKALIADLTE